MNEKILIVDDEFDILKTLPMGPLLNETVPFFFSGANVTCHLQISQDLWWTHVDQAQMSRAIHNVVLNAIEAMRLMIPEEQRAGSCRRAVISSWRFGIREASFVKKHNGFVFLESEKSVGTTVFIYLPASPRTETEIKAALSKPFLKGSLRSVVEEALN